MLKTLDKLSRPVVGDWVAVVDGADRASIQQVCDRRTTLVRRAAGTKREPQVVAANVDMFFVVTAANRDFNERRLERYVTAVWNSGAEPVVVLNKIDLDDDLKPLTRRSSAPRSACRSCARARRQARASTNYARISAPEAPSVSSARRASASRRSRTGCSAETCKLWRGLRNDDRGRHTTTARQLIELADGGVLIDTPGMRELGLLDDEGIDTTFADVAAFAEHCRFRDCTHMSEPGCAVIAAAETGALPAERLASYRKLVREIAAAARASDPLLASRTKGRWKATHRAMRARSKVDPKLKRD